MLVKSFVAPIAAANCWFIATGRGQECAIVDPGGPDVSWQISQMCLEYDLKPVAVFLTHGHVDHTFSVAPTCAGYSIPAYIHSEDRILLTHPEKALSPLFAATLEGSTFFEPSDVRELRNGEILDLLGMKIRITHAPGHTRGSLLYQFQDDSDQQVLITGDVLFAGSVGRTDLPSGSAVDMENTLRKKIWPLPDSLRVLPGHGPETTIGREKMVNPFLKELRLKP